MRRRGAGVSAIAHRDALDAKFRALGVERAKEREEQTKEQLAKFTASLEQFAAAHRSDIRADPEFRAAFHAMCANVGVDPLASRKSAWGQLLGFGEFYVELAVCVADCCLASRAHDGGLCTLDALVERVNKRRGSVAGDVSADDVERAIEALGALGGGWSVDASSSASASASSASLGRNKSNKMVRSVPLEMSDDVNACIARARETSHGCLSASALAETSGWTLERARDALESAVKLGISLVDDQHESGVRAYWFPAFRLELSGD